MATLSLFSSSSLKVGGTRPPQALWLRLVLAAAIGCGGGLLPTLVTPPAAQAYTSRVNLFLVREQGESFETLVQRSEIIARAAIQRSFDADVLMTDVVVTVIGDNQGISVPILTVPVSRADWRLRPDVNQWARYFDAARALVTD
ncbi:MAG TPA: hypothetical protein VLS96_02580 [Nodosilinea sp.]|nr:hypothetical protein [Nodosilinea sp.]